MTTLLIADDEQTFLDFMVRLLQKDHNLLIARSWSEVLEKFEANLWKLNATILDVNMPGLSVDPFTMIEKLLKSNRTVPMIIISGQDIVLRHEFLKMGVFQYHGKPLDMVDLKLTIQSAIEHNKALRKLENFEKNKKDVVKHFQSLLNVNLPDLQERINNQDTPTQKSPVLIRYEKGARPAMLAKIISEEIDRKLLFRKVCTKSLKNLIPYNIQNGDTLYLEGIENLDREEIAFLLNLMQQLHNPDGADGSKRPTFRLIASVSNLPNGEIRNESEFLQLLEYFAKVEIRIEPLRLRKHELREIITLIFEKNRKKFFSAAHTISEELYDLLINYNWALNLDELDMVIRGLIMTCKDSVIMQKHLHQLDFSDMANSKYPTLDEMVDEHIKKALRMTMGNKSRAAKMLGITPKTLYSRIRN